MEEERNRIKTSLNRLIASEADDAMIGEIYELYAVLWHQGQVAEMGHYWIDVKSDIQSNTWYRYNDQNVTKVCFELELELVNNVALIDKVRGDISGLFDFFLCLSLFVGVQKNKRINKIKEFLSIYWFFHL